MARKAADAARWNAPSSEHLATWAGWHLQELIETQPGAAELRDGGRGGLRNCKKLQLGCGSASGAGFSAGYLLKAHHRHCNIRQSPGGIEPARCDPRYARPPV